MRHKKEYTYTIIALGSIGLIWFLMTANLIPLFLSEDLNKAVFAAQEGDCDTAFRILEEIPENTHLNPYIANQYIDSTTLCINQIAEPQRSQLIQEVLSKMETRAQQHPYDTKTFIALTAYTNLLLADEKDSVKAKELISTAKEYLQKAQELSPKREELDERLIYTLMLGKEYALAKEKALQCINRFPQNSACAAWGLIAQLWLGERDSLYLGSLDPPYDEDVARHFYLPNFLGQLLQFYVLEENYGQLIEVYFRLIRIEETPQYYASLALAYSKIGGWDAAARYSIKVYQLQPAAKEQVREFLENALAKDKATSLFLYTKRVNSWQPYKDIEKAFPGIFKSL
jgi:tetratricopeptide (TPR) repeat protein